MGDYARGRLDLDDDAASDNLRKTINDSVNLLMPQLMERVHQAAQKSRK